MANKNSQGFSQKDIGQNTKLYLLVLSLQIINNYRDTLLTEEKKDYFSQVLFVKQNVNDQVCFAQILTGGKYDWEIHLQHYMYPRQEYRIGKNSSIGFAYALHSEYTFHGSVQACKRIMLEYMSRFCDHFLCVIFSVSIQGKSRGYIFKCQYKIFKLDNWKVV